MADRRKESRSTTMGMRVASHAATAIARFLLLLYPRDFRADVGSQLVEDYRLRSAARMEARGVFGWFFWLIRSVVSLVANAPAAWRERRTATDFLGASQVRIRGQSMVSLDLLLYDLRYAVRQLAGAPILTAVASASIAVGILVAVGAFSFLNAIRFKTLPVPEPQNIYHVYTSGVGGRERLYLASSYPDYLDFAESGAFSGLAAATRGQLVALSVGGGPASTGWLAFVSSNYFQVLRLPLALGRVPDANEQGVVLAYRYWQRAYASDAGVLGTPLSVNGEELVVTGVAPEDFTGTALDDPIAGWAPVHLLPTLMSDSRALENRGSHRFDVIGRLEPGGSVEAALERLNGVASSLFETEPAWADQTGQRRLVSALPDRDSRVTPDNRDDWRILVSAVGTLVFGVLVIICTNVASLLLGRAIARRREVAVRVALGATRGRLATQLFIESLLLALLGGVSGLATFSVGLDVAGRIPLLQTLNLTPDLRVLWATLLISTLTALICGAAPILHSLRSDVRSGLGAGPGTKRGNRLRGVLIGAQVAVSCLLIMGAVSTAQVVRARTSEDAGIGLDGLLEARIPTRFSLGNQVGDLDFGSRPLEIEELIRESPGVRGVAKTSLLPLGASRGALNVRLPSGDTVRTGRNNVGAELFATLGVRVLEGRTFTEADGADAPGVVVVSRAFQDAFPQVSIGSMIGAGAALPTGETVVVRAGDLGLPGPAQVIGVVEDVLYHSADEAPEPMVYLHTLQTPWDTYDRLVVRVPAGQEQEIATSLRTRIQERFPDMLPTELTPLRDVLRAQALPERIASRVALGVGTAEMILATIGLYGLLLYVLSSRNRELAVRLALGARPGEASWAVLRNGLRYAILGGAAGLLLGLPAKRVLEPLTPVMFAPGVAPFIIAFGAVVLACVAASLVPALRAARVQPAVALRDE